MFSASYIILIGSNIARPTELINNNFIILNDFITFQHEMSNLLCTFSERTLISLFGWWRNLQIIYEFRRLLRYFETIVRSF